MTITQVETSSRSKMRGPCWIAIGEVYASTKPREIVAEVGDKITANGKTILRAATRTDTQRQSWDLWVTGNPEDTVELRIGLGHQVVRAVVTGVSETPPA